MPMKRISVRVDPEDLALIREAARRKGVSQARLLREAIHQEALANEAWNEPLFSRTFSRRDHHG